MSETIVPVTKAAALERFITERVLGDRPLATQHGVCSYRHNVAGGCEIGQYLPEALAAKLPARTWASIYEEVPAVRAYFEAPSSHFWTWLQKAHDILADFVSNQGNGDDLNDDRWDTFQSHLFRAVSYL